MKKIILLFVTLVFLLSCDPEDSRFTFINKTKDSLIVRLMFDKELPNNPNYWNRSREIKVKPMIKTKISIFNKWEGEFKRALPDTLINVIVTKYYNFEINPRCWDSLFINKSYYLKKYSLQDLKNRNWVIEYPNDGFKLSAP